MNPTAPVDIDPSAGPTADPEVPAGPSAPQPAPVTAPSGLVIAGAVVGLGALLVSAIPLVNVLSVLGGIAAAVVGIVALRRLTPGAAGRGLAVAAIVLGSLATAIATAVLLVLGTLMISGDSVTVGELGPEELVDEWGEPIDEDAVVVLP